MSEEQETPNSETPVTPTEEEQTTLITEPKPEEKPAEEPKVEEPKEEAKEVVPLTAEDLTIPEGFEAIEPLRDDFLKILNDGELSGKDRANALLDLHVKTINAAQEADSKAFGDMQETWKTEAKNEFGDKLQPTITSVAKLIDEYGSDELRNVFNFTGAGNNVHVIKFLGKIADTLTEGTHVGGAPRGELTEEDKARRIFPSMPR